MTNDECGGREGGRRGSSFLVLRSSLRISACGGGCACDAPRLPPADTPLHAKRSFARKCVTKRRSAGSRSPRVSSRGVARGGGIDYEYEQEHDHESERASAWWWGRSSFLVPGSSLARWSRSRGRLCRRR